MKSVAGKTFPAFPAHAQLTILRIWLEAHSQDFVLIFLLLLFIQCQFLDIVLDFILMAILLVQIYENKIVSKEVKEMRHYVTTTRRTVLNGDGVRIDVGRAYPFQCENKSKAA